MQVNHPAPLTDEQRRELEQLGSIAASDDATTLVDGPLDRKAQRRARRRGLRAFLHPPGSVRRMSDGTQYVVGDDGAWRKETA